MKRKAVLVRGAVFVMLAAGADTLCPETPVYFTWSRIQRRPKFSLLRLSAIKIFTKQRWMRGL